jgi:mRNA-degrading endonuclease RelE of RelBE toxin-antitoxin system
MSRKILIEKSSERTFRALDDDTQAQLRELVDEIAKTPKVSEHPKVRQMRGPCTEAVYRLRKGDQRLVFTTDKGRLLIHRVGDRSTVYDNINSTYDKIKA